MWTNRTSLGGTNGRGGGTMYQVRGVLGSLCARRRPDFLKAAMEANRASLPPPPPPEERGDEERGEEEGASSS